MSHAVGILYHFALMWMVYCLLSLVHGNNTLERTGKRSQLPYIDYKMGDRIRGGEKVTNKVYPAHIMLMVGEQRALGPAMPANDNYICGGTLIELNLVVTAAHCLYDKEGKGLIDPARFRIRAGEYTMNEEDELDSKQVRRLYSFLHNGKYTGKFTEGSDIAMIRLLKPFKKTKEVNRIDKCTEAQEKDKSLPVLIAGFGLTGYDDSGEPVSAKYLKQLYVKEVAPAFCSSPKGPPEKSIVCVETTGEDDRNALCKGDSGSGLYKMNRKNEKPLCVYAVVSMGPGCKGKSVYTTFTRLSYYEDSMSQVFVSSMGPEKLRKGQSGNKVESSLILIFVVTGILVYSLKTRKRVFLGF